MNKTALPLGISIIYFRFLFHCPGGGQGFDETMNSFLLMRRVTKENNDAGFGTPALFELDDFRMKKALTCERYKSKQDAFRSKRRKKGAPPRNETATKQVR